MTDDDFGRLRTRLADLADTPAPASPFDAVRTAATGRRRVLARRASTVGGTGALAVAAVFGIAAVFGPAGSSQAATPASGIGADPMAKYLDYGWLPASLPYVSYEAGTNAAQSNVTAQGDITSPDGAARVDLNLLPDGALGTPKNAERFIPAKLGDGRQVYWVTQPYSQGDFAGEFQLRFPTDNGQWAALTWSVNGKGAVYGTNSKISGVAANPNAKPGSPAPTFVPVSQQWQQDLLHMAAQVKDDPAQIPMPLRVTGLPSNFKPSETFLWRPGGNFGDGAPGTWKATLVFMADGGQVVLEVGPQDTVAATEPHDKGTKCMVANGLDACVSVSGHVPAFEDLGGANKLLKMVTLLGPDENQWTTDVLVP